MNSRLWTIAALLLVTATVTTVACAPPARASVQTLRLIPAFFRFGTSPLLRAGAPSVSETDIDLGPEYPGATLHVYHPTRGAHPGMLISLGIDPAPMDDPRVVSLATGMARDGITAALVDSPDLDAGRLTPVAPGLLVDAFQRLSEQPTVDPSHIGILGLSVGGSLALKAAADPRIAHRVRLVEAVGAYYSLQNLARSVVTKSQVTGDQTEHWDPAPLAQTAVPENLIALIGPSDSSMLLDARNPQTFDAAVATLPASDAAVLDLLSPKSSLDKIQAPVFLMVDEADPLIPPSESKAIAAGLRHSGARVYLSTFQILRHVEPGGGKPPLTLAGDLLHLFVHVNLVLQRLES
jgi:pimeloyl-ACP methyl ester carboxylesterase